MNTTEFSEMKVAYYIGVYGMFLLGIVGTVTQILAFIVFSRFKPATSSTLYLQALALSDLISLQWDSIISTALPMLGVPTEGSSTWACKLGIWHNMASSIASSCALLVVAVDRAVLLTFPGFYKTYCTRKCALIITIGLWIITYAYTTPLLYFYEIIAPQTCAISADALKQYAGLKFVTFISYGPYFSIPVVGIIISNIIIIKIVYERKKNRKKIGKNDNTDADELSLLLISDCIAFLILIGVVAALWALTWQVPNDEHEKAKFHLMFVLAEFISCT